ncbi:MAG TPA: transaldolase family protein [Polyangiaceae bacterium]
MLFLDSSDPDEIRALFAWGVLAGVTTNPLLLSREAPKVELETRIRAVCKASRGPVSVELLAETEQEMIEEGLRYHAWLPERVVVKVPLSGEIAMRVLAALASRGVPTNATCLMSFQQAYLAALAGATYVSLLAGRIRDMGYDARPAIASTRAALDREQLPSRIIIGSIRQTLDVSEAVDAGAHIVTVPPAVLRKMLVHPQTERTVREFNDAWKGRGSG